MTETRVKYDDGKTVYPPTWTTFTVIDWESVESAMLGDRIIDAAMCFTWWDLAAEKDGSVYVHENRRRAKAALVSICADLEAFRWARSPDDGADLGV